MINITVPAEKKLIRAEITHRKINIFQMLPYQYVRTKYLKSCVYFCKHIETFSATFLHCKKEL